MAYIIVFLMLYLVVVLFFWSLCAIQKVLCREVQKRARSAAIENGILDSRLMCLRCQAYDIRSLYSRDFICLEEPQRKYVFRTPLPSFEEECSDLR